MKIEISEDNEIKLLNEDNSIILYFHVSSISWFELVETNMCDDDIRRVWLIINTLLNR